MTTAMATQRNPSICGMNSPEVVSRESLSASLVLKRVIGAVRTRIAENGAIREAARIAPLIDRNLGLITSYCQVLRVKRISPVGVTAHYRSAAGGSSVTSLHGTLVACGCG